MADQVQSAFESLINWNKTIGPNYVPEKGEIRFDQIVSPGQFGILTGFIIILFLNYKFEFKAKFVHRLLVTISQGRTKETILVVTFFLASLMLLPLFSVVIFCLWIKKILINQLLMKEQKRFGFQGMLSGPDLVWSCESDHSKAVINILAYVEVTNDKRFAEKFLDSLKQRFIDQLVKADHPYQKMFYRRAKEQDYHYWTNKEQLSIHDYVRFLEPTNERKFLSEEEFAQIMSKISNENLPGDNTALWEVLIGQQIVRSKANGPGKLPIIFRVHHALGDGVALLRLLLKVISDKTDVVSELPIVEKDIPKPSKSMFFNGQLLSMLLMILKLPHHLFEQIAYSPTRNSMDCEDFSGDKVVNWIYESDSNDLISIVKHLKNKIPGVKFSDIILTALSKSLKKYFEARNQKPPKNMMVAIPARLCHEEEDFKIHNKFSVALRDLPIKLSTNSSSKTNEIHDRIQLVKQHGDDLNNSIDYFFNCWMMEHVFTLMPETLLKKLLSSNHATMAISNLPGPMKTVKVNNHEIINIGFFIPNIGKTAVGVSILSYGGKLHFGMMADNQAVKTAEEIKEVLEGMVWEILSMATVLL